MVVEQSAEKYVKLSLSFHTLSYSQQVIYEYSDNMQIVHDPGQAATKQLSKREKSSSTNIVMFIKSCQLCKCTVCAVCLWM